MSSTADVTDDRHYDRSKEIEEPPVPIDLDDPKYTSEWLIKNFCKDKDIEECRQIIDLDDKFKIALVRRITNDLREQAALYSQFECLQDEITGIAPENQEYDLAGDIAIYSMWIKYVRIIKLNMYDTLNNGDMSAWDNELIMLENLLSAAEKKLHRWRLENLKEQKYNRFAYNRG